MKGSESEKVMMFPFSKPDPIGNRNKQYDAENTLSDQRDVPNHECMSNTSGSGSSAETVPVTNSSNAAPAAPETPRNFLTELLEISLPNQPRGAKLGLGIRPGLGLFFGLGRMASAISNNMRTVLIFLKFLGFFPGFVRVEKRVRRRYEMLRLTAFALTFLGVCLNIYFFKTNVEMLIRYQGHFGFLHATTVCTIITGIKPFINAVLLLLMVIRLRPHVRMLRMMDTVDNSFRRSFGKSPPIRRYNKLFAFAVLFSILLPLSYRVFESIWMDIHGRQKRTLYEWLTDLSFILVPLLTAWNMIPLFYYVFCNRVVCFWCRTLKKCIQREHHQRQFSLKFYYEQFLRITSLQKAIGSVFNPIVFFSLAWSLLMLSLTIYFLTQPASRLVEPITVQQISSERARKELTERVYINLGWSVIQISVAIAHIVFICSTGLQTNEETRKIINAVLEIVPDTNAEIDRFQINCFVHKMSTQYMWGMTVWRAFPLERTTFFTLVSVMFTYSFLLLKLKDNPAVSPIIRQIIQINGTQVKGVF